MLRRIEVLALILFSACATQAEDESVLWWMFDAKTEIREINGSGETYTIDTLVGRGESAGLTVNGIRIGAYNGDSLLGYLNFGEYADEYYIMPTIEGDYDPETGTFTPTGVSWDAGPEYANLGSYASIPGVTFMIELGNWDDSLGVGNEWRVLAHSDAETMENLKGFLDVADYDMHTTLEWTGGAYAVPEPTSGVLVLFGLSFLALRRKRVEKEAA